MYFCVSWGAATVHDICFFVLSFSKNHVVVCRRAQALQRRNVLIGSGTRCVSRLQSIATIFVIVLREPLQNCAPRPFYRGFWGPPGAQCAPRNSCRRPACSSSSNSTPGDSAASCRPAPRGHRRRPASTLPLLLSRATQKVRRVL